MRLIDADALIEKVRQWYWDKEKQGVDPMFADLWVNLFITTINETQTAFEVEERILEKMKTEKSTAREILSIIEKIYFSDKFKEYRVNYGSNGTRDLIIKTIQERYDIK